MMAMVCSILKDSNLEAAMSFVSFISEVCPVNDLTC